MNTVINYITILGFTGQALFFSRFAVQLFLSEKQQKVVTPTIFWKLSLLAAIIFFMYGYLREDFSIMLGQLLTYYIYIRNLQLQQKWQNIPRVLRLFLLLFPTTIFVYLYKNGFSDLFRFINEENIATWILLLGIIGQLVFVFRFIYQWITSEKRKKSQLSLGFWLLSLLGAILIFTYAILRKDIVLLVAHGVGMIMYLRNIYLAKKVHESAKP